MVHGINIFETQNDHPSTVRLLSGRKYKSNTLKFSLQEMPQFYPSSQTSKNFTDISVNQNFLGFNIPLIHKYLSSISRVPDISQAPGQINMMWSV